MRFSVTLDVPDLAAGIAFYGAVFGFAEIARPVATYAVLEAAGQTLGLMQKAEGTAATPAEATERRYSRHWTPVHLDFHVEDWGAARDAIERLGGRIEQEHRVPGRSVIAFCSDPFGHGFCLLGPQEPAA
jgi:predicted enzyme related to lactoylglutathione lyase